MVLDLDNRQTRRTRRIQIGTVWIGGGERVAVQSMCATRTSDIPATLQQIRLLERAGADFIRIAVDSRNDIEALRALRQETNANIIVDLQENYRLIEKIAPFVQKFRYNPGHLHHHQTSLAVAEKVKFLVDVAGANDCAIRIGINFGSLDPTAKGRAADPAEAALESAAEHVQLIEKLGFERFLVSLKSSDPHAVVMLNKKFSSLYPEIPLHLGVTEAGMLPEGEIKSRMALEPLLSAGIGDTVRVSLTLPDNEKDKEIIVARKIIEDVREGRLHDFPDLSSRLNVISCPSCSRVENKAFVQLAQQVREAIAFAKDEQLTVAVMGCRVNGPGETDHADLGLWCAPTFVNLKRKGEVIGKFSYTEVVPRLIQEVKALVGESTAKINR